MLLIARLLAVSLLLFGGLSHAFAPQAGTWVVAAELDGRPGRGLAIDVQNDVFVMQVYAYESSGHPTFYLAVGTLRNNEVVAPLNRYAGGRYFGGPGQSGVEAGTAGTVRIRFTSGISGFATFPGEPEKAIVRANFAYPFGPSSLRGIWSLTSLGSEGLLADAVSLTVTLQPTRTGNGLVATADGLFGCEHQITGNLAGGVLCVRINSAGQLLRAYFYVYSINDGEGYSQRSGTGTEQLMWVRRLTNPQGTGTGIALREEALPAAEHPALRMHLQEVALTGRMP